MDVGGFKKVVMDIPLSLLQICEDAWALNVLAREKRLRKVAPRGFYCCKNELIKYLYTHGYCREVLEHVQKFECWNCDGDGCYRCDNGVYKRIYLYAFKFLVGGRCFKWHQPQSLVDYPVELTDPAPTVYDTPAPKQIDPSTRDEVWMLARLALGLRLRGARELPRLNLYALLPAAPRQILRGLGIRLERARDWVLFRLPWGRCPECHALFRKPGYNYGWKDRAFCSQRCADDWIPF